ncbi:MAG: hypothetical protein ACQEWG_02030 [Bacteroidota bacterium]
MKKLLLVFFYSTIITACSSDEDNGGMMQNLAVITTVELPDHFEYNQEYEIKINYRRPTNCDFFSGFDISKSSNKITVGVVTSYSTSNTTCVRTGNLNTSIKLNFVADRDDFYIFKFWQGKNTSGEVQFLTVEVPVTRPGM